MEEIYADSTDTTLEVVVYGQTEENRPLVYLKMTNGDVTDKPVAIIEAAINPREWITVSSALNVVNRLLEEDNRGFLDDSVWIVVPVMNPDGYEYTHTNVSGCRADNDKCQKYLTSIFKSGLNKLNG